MTTAPALSTTRRDFLKAAALSGVAAAGGMFPESIARAMAIEPAAGTSVLDAEHVVILMQENRSFDHTFGTLRGVRGFEDPRAITLPGGVPVWAQPDREGHRYLPFRLNLKETKATWMGSLPHGWADQVDARNEGRYDRWLDVKRSSDADFAKMPLTMGHYTRQDIPFYYALADAFTVCDQNFCSSLTGTTPNRLHLWTGTIRAEQSADAMAHVLNEDADFNRYVTWPTFPERLEELDVSWRVYQNELSVESGLTGEHDAWLANFGDNPLEYFTQYGARFAPAHRAFVKKRLSEIPAELAAKEAALASANAEQRRRLEREIAALRRAEARYKQERREFSQERFDALPARLKRLHERAFTINSAGPDFRELAELSYRDGDVERRVLAPKGDVLHQFRKDAAEGKLPAVSWLVPSERFSDHPGSAWYGAWYLSEVLDILTKNPAVWKKTVFILTYDENDGYFDHVPPFVSPDPARPETGRVSEGIDASLEFVPLERDRQWHPRAPRGSAIGLGYRVPMIIASPWSRGGAVCSQVFDHTSVLQFVEKLLTHRTGKKVEEPNINRWRRTVCGDLMSAFRSADDPSSPLEPIRRDEFVKDIHRAQFKGLPTGYRSLTAGEVEEMRRTATRSPLMPRQEPGGRPSCPLPYELFVTGSLNAARDELLVRLEARNTLFREKAAGVPFTAYAFRSEGEFACRNYAVEAGKVVEDSWRLSAFKDGRYHVRVYGPNGYFWELVGSAEDPALAVELGTAGVDERGTRAVDVEILLSVTGVSRDTIDVTARDNAYGHAEQTGRMDAGERTSIRMPTARSSRWYDFTLCVAGAPRFERRFAGRLETGEWGVSDPRIGAVG